MATHFVKQQVGVADGTVNPVLKADAREVNAQKKSTLASKVTGTIWAVADLIYLGKKPAGHKVVGVKVDSDTSFGASTIAIGTLDTPAKYVAAQTMTVVNTPTALKLLASTLDDDPGDEEDLYALVAVADIAAATIATFEIEMVGL